MKERGLKIENNDFQIEDLIVNSNENIEKIAEENSNKIKQFLEKDKITQISDKQTKFYSDCTKLILSELNTKLPIIIPAKCGFGKSTFIKTLIETLISHKDEVGEEYMQLIVVANRINDLNDLKNSIEKEHGRYGDIPYITVLQSWNKNIKCLNERDPILNYKASQNRCNQNCEYKECSLIKQYKEMDISPILAITTERLNMISKENSIDKYKFFHNNTKKREFLLIDEKPVIFNNKSISLADINELKNILLKYQTNRNKQSIYNKKKSDILDKLDSIEKLLISYIKDYDKYDNFFILPEEIDFMTDWKMVFGNKYNKKTANIKQMFENGIVWNKYRNNFYLIQDTTFNTGDLKTFIFDGTASMTLEYRNRDFVTIKMDDYKDFNNLTFHVINESISKSKIKEYPEKLTAICDWINSYFKTDTYVISYKEALGYKVDEKLTEKLKNNSHIILDDNKVPHFGNTKGENLWNKCNNMVQIGWNILDSGSYIAKYLSLNAGEKEKLISLKNEPHEIYSLLKNSNGVFDNIDIDIHKIFDMIVNFEQEVFRTNIREFSSTEMVNVYVFLSSNKNNDYLKALIEVRFWGCKVKEYKVKELGEYNEKKYLNSKGREDIKKFINWLDGKLANSELKGKNHGVLTREIEEDLNIKIRWGYHIKKKSEFYKLLIARRVKIDKNREKQLEVYKY